MSAPAARHRRFASAAALIFVDVVGGCRGGRQVTLDLATGPDAGLAGVSGYTVTARWDGGGLGPLALTALDASAEALFPSGVAIDVEVDGSSPAGPWRGERRGLVLASGGDSSATLYFAPVGSMAGFLPLGSLGPTLAGMAATPLGLGQVLVTGGRLPDGGSSRQVWLWDQATLRFSAAPETALPWADHLALALGDGRVLLSGGLTSAIEIYDLQSGGHIAGALSRPQLRPSGVVLPGGTVAIGCGAAIAAADGGTPGDGGQDGPQVVIELWPDGGILLLPDGGPLDCADGQLVDADDLGADGGFGPVAVLPAGELVALAPGRPTLASFRQRSSFSAAADGQGGVVVAGGLDSRRQPSALVDVLDPQGGQQLAALSQPRFACAVAPLAAGVLAIGGFAEGGLATAELLPNGGRAPVFLSLTGPRRFPAAAVVPGYHLVLIVSGDDGAGSPAPGLDVFSAP